MSAYLGYPGSRTEPAEHIPVEPVTCVVCGWWGEAEVHSGDYRRLRCMPFNHPEYASEDVICNDCTLYCVDCGDDLLDKGDFLGCYAGGALLCWPCMADAVSGVSHA